MDIYHSLTHNMICDRLEALARNGTIRLHNEQSPGKMMIATLLNSKNNADRYLCIEHSAIQTTTQIITALREGEATHIGDAIRGNGFYRITGYKDYVIALARQDALQPELYGLHLP